MRRWLIGLGWPAGLALLAWAAVWAFGVEPRTRESVGAGLLVAFLQSALCTGALFVARDNRFFYGIWLGGVAFRFVVFAAMVAAAYRFERLDLVFTLVSLVTATTAFLVIESAVLFADQT